ncbi:MAG TPA: NAD-dependent epimerase/dehydratase family protein [Atribacterota bacterium]|nr:NAD-dependent epimerase/dehydratase family protein [Atribacterota bacterium]
MRTILVTGSEGFIGKNLIVRLQELNDIKIKSFDKDDNIETLKKYLRESDIIFHFAGVNRPKNVEEFEKVNAGLTTTLIKLLEEVDNKIPIVITSSIQAELNNPYGQSKKIAEDELVKYAERNSVPIYIYRLPNVFGKWSRPNYNSVVSTFCYNISHNLEITISDPTQELELVYIDDVINEFVSLLNREVGDFHKYYCNIVRTFKITLGELADRLYKIKEIRKTLIVPDLSDIFMKFLHSTYLSYLDKDDFSYKMDSKEDNRGSFVELMKSKTFGQVSVSRSRKGVTRGNHYHNTKNEKFCVIQGKAVIKLRKVLDDKVIPYYVSDKKIEVVDIPPGYTHSIENLTEGDGEMILLIWANEIFNPKNPDTYYCEV